MTPTIDRDILHLLRQLRRRHGDNVSLEALARRSGWSPFCLIVDWAISFGGWSPA